MSWGAGCRRIGDRTTDETNAMPQQKVEEFWRVRIDSNVWEQVLHLGLRQKFSHGEEIISAGERVERLCYLHSGEVCMKRTSMEGSEKIIMHIAQHSLFCEVPFFTDCPITSSFVCHQDATVYFFPRETVDAMVAEHPEIAKDIIRTLSEKVSVLCNQSASLGLDSLEQRIVKFILLQYNSLPLHSNEIISLGSLKMKDIAGILSVHRVTLYKAFKELESRGFIKMLSRNRLQIIDIESLSAIAYE